MDQPVRLELPSSAEILAALVDAFDLRAYLPALGADRSVRAYLDGERHSPEVMQRAHEYVAQAILEADLVPRELRLADFVPPALLTVPRGAVRTVARFIRAHGDAWDVARGTLRERAAPVAFPALARAAVLRLYAIDLAVRLGAATWLVRHDASEAPQLYWLVPGGIGDRLAELVRAAGLTRVLLAERLGVHEHTVDAWLDADRRPERANLEALARTISGSAGAMRVRRELHIAYAGRALLDRLSPSVDPIEAAEAVCKIALYRTCVLAVLVRSRRTREANDLAMRETLVGGADVAHQPWVVNLLVVAGRNEADPVWRSSIRAVSESAWIPELQRTFANLGPVSPADRTKLQRIWGTELTDENLQSLAYRAQARLSEQGLGPAFAAAAARAAGNREAAVDHKIRASEVAAYDLPKAIELGRAATALDPSNADAHFRLGAWLWQAGETEEALVELRISVGLGPQWDRPRVEIAIVLGNQGRHEEALGELQRAEQELDTSTAWIALHLAYTLEQLGRVGQAIMEYQRYIRLEPRSAEALDRLAHLLFVDGDKRGGARRAKEAGALGVGTVLRAWQDGHYQGGSVERPPHAWALRTHFGPRADPPS